MAGQRLNPILPPALSRFSPKKLERTDYLLHIGCIFFIFKAPATPEEEKKAEHQIGGGRQNHFALLNQTQT